MTTPNRIEEISLLLANLVVRVERQEAQIDELQTRIGLLEAGISPPRRQPRTDTGACP